MSPSELAAWVGGTALRTGNTSGSLEDDARADDHGYLFGRPGSPTDLRLMVVSRPYLVLYSSLAVLTLGLFLLLAWRPPFRIAWVASLALILAVATAVESSVTILVLQSSVLGMILTILAVIIRRIEERRRPSDAVFGDPNHLLVSQAAGSTVIRAGGAGSDDSTAIRVRPASTMDHLPMTQSAAAEGAAGRAPQMRDD
jgi:hypothetical protein